MSASVLMNEFTEYEEYIREKVSKNMSGKPFKSGEKINTVKGIITHPILKIPAFVFFEDDSYVECRRCLKVTINT